MSQADLAAMKQTLTHQHEQLALARQTSADLQRNRDSLANGTFKAIDCLLSASRCVVVGIATA